MCKRVVTVILALTITSGIALAKPGDLDTSFNSPAGYVLYEPGISGAAIAIRGQHRLAVQGQDSCSLSCGG